MWHVHLHLEVSPVDWKSYNQAFGDGGEFLMKEARVSQDKRGFLF